MRQVVFSIPDMNRLVDCFRDIMPSRVFEPNADGLLEGWPSFHVSQADPDGGYRSYTYTVRFRLDRPQDLSLCLGLIASTPRMPYVRLTLNGGEGFVYPHPEPSKDKEIRPAHALHAAIYNRQDVRVFLPQALTRAGKNELSITAMDDKPDLLVTNHEAVLRLDRMADACGWHYGALAMEAGCEEQPDAAVRPSVLYVRRDGQLMERIDCTLTPRAGVERVAGALTLRWQGGEMTVPYDLPAHAFGEYTFSCWLPDGEGEVTYALTGAVERQGAFRRSRKWKVFITPHAHTDIGYTHRQWEVAERMSRNLDTAIDTLLEKPDFSYILDSSWAIDDFLATRSPERRALLMELIRQGRIGVPTNYVDLLTQTASLEDLIHNSEFSDALLSPEGLRADRVDMVDVASATSAYPTVMAGMGVKWMLHANNQDRGPFRFNGGLHRKSPFWWEGPDGSRILVWLSRMYCELKKVCGSPGTLAAAERGLEMWLQDYAREDYAPDAVVLYGMEADNTDIDVRMAGFVSDWKAAYAYPELVPSNGSSFFEYVMKWRDTFPVYRGDEGAWWEDGAASSLRESVALRRAQAGLKAAEALDSLAALHCGGQFPLKQYDEAWKQVVLYDEHTWGAFLSQENPDALLQEDAWACKKHMADDAFARTSALLTRSASRLSLMWNNEGREIVVYNPYSFPVTGWAEAEIARSETVCGADGREIAWRVLRQTATQQRILLPVRELAGFSYARYVLRPKAAGDHAGAVRARAASPRTVLENAFYRAVIDTEVGTVCSLIDKALGRELCREPVGELLYAMGGEGSTLRGNHAEFRRDGAKIVHAFLPTEHTVEESPVDTRVILRGQAFRGSAEVAFILPHDRKELRLSFRYDKEATTAMEAVYVAFPFAMGDGARVLSDSHIGWVDWQDGVLPGACREWLPLQTSVLVEEPGCAIQLASPEAFLFTVNSPVTGKWSSELNVRGGRIYSYVLNNYWHTNYLGLQGGVLEFSYALTSAGTISPEEAFRYGWTQRRGPVAQRMSYQERRVNVPAVFSCPAGGTLMRAESDHIAVNTIRRSRADERAFILRLLETGGRAGSLTVEIPGFAVRAMQDVDHLEHPLGEPYAPRPVEMKPWQLRTVRLWLKKEGGE